MRREAVRRSAVRVAAACVCLFAALDAWAMPDGGKSSFEPRLGDQPGWRQELERRAAAPRSDADRRVEEARRKSEQNRAAKDRKAKQPIAPKVIEVQYDDENGAVTITSNDGQSTSNVSREAPEQDRAATPLLGPVPYRNDDHYFSLRLPVGWRPFSAAELSQCNAAARVQVPTAAIQYEAGFLPQLARPGSPYILVQTKAAKTRSYEELELAIERELPQAVEDIQDNVPQLAGVSIGKAILDRANNRVVMRLTSEVRGVGTLQSLSIGHIGSSEVVFLHCYAPDEHFERWLPTFEQIDQSFEFDEGYAFAPPAPAPTADAVEDVAPPASESANPIASGASEIAERVGKSIDWNGWLVGGLIGSLFGSAAGVLVWLVRRVSMPSY